MKREHSVHAQHSHQTLGLALTVGLLGAASATAQTTQRVSLGKNNVEPVYWSEHSDLTPDGRFIVFASADWKLLMLAQPFGVPLDAGRAHIYRRDTQTGEIVLASVDSLHEPNNGDSAEPSISNDGGRIAFASDGPQIETLYFLNGKQWKTVGDMGWDIFVRDLTSGVSETRLISFGRDVDAQGKPIQVSANGETRQPQISGDGQHIVYASRATNLSSGDADARWDVYVYDWNADQTKSISTLVSVNSMGVKGNRDCVAPAISDDGRYIVFESASTNLVKSGVAGKGPQSNLYIHDRDTDGDGVFDEPGAISTKLIGPATSAVH